MKKKVLFSIAMISAAMAGSMPITSQAANVKAIRVQTGNLCNEYSTNSTQAGKYCKIYSGTDLQQLLEEIGGTGNNCPNLSIPGTNNPGTSGGPGTDAGTPEQPDVQGPEQGEIDADLLIQAEQVVRLVNEERAKAGLSAVQMQTDLTQAANIRAKEIKQQFSHTRPDGRSYSSVLTDQGISYRMSGENIAYGQKDANVVMEGWMNSSGHRANILNGNFTKIGVGLYEDESGVKHWVQLFT